MAPQKRGELSLEQKRALIEREHPSLSVRRQCELLGISRSGLYYEPASEDPYNLQLCRLLDEQYTRTPFYGIRRMTAWLKSQGEEVNHKRVSRLMHLLGLETLYPRPRTSVPDPEHRVYPYLLRNTAIERVNQVWSTDITYIRMSRGFLYLVAVLDWYSRYVLSWQLSNTLETAFCVQALEVALQQGQPEVFNTDQGVQFTSRTFTRPLTERGIAISMDGRGRALDNVFVERLWRSVKYEEVYLKEYQDGWEAEAGLGSYFQFYNHDRLHQALGYRTPASIYTSALEGGATSMPVGHAA